MRMENDKHQLELELEAFENRHRSFMKGQDGDNITTTKKNRKHNKKALKRRKAAI